MKYPLSIRIMLKFLRMFKFEFLVTFYFYMSDVFRIIADEILVKKYGGMHPKHGVMRYYQFFLDYINEDFSVLDVGSSNGNVSLKMSEKAKKVVGVEIEKSHYEWAQANRKAENVEYHNMDIFEYKPSSKFDLCVMSNVLEHIENRVPLLKKVGELSPRLAVRVPAIDRHWSVPFRKEMGIEWRCDHTHYTEYTDDELEQELKDSGWKVVNHVRKWGEIYVYCER